MAILNLRAARQQLGAQRNDDVFHFNISITESLYGSNLSSDISITAITNISTNSNSQKRLMDTTITDDSDTTIISKTTSDSDSSMMSLVFDFDEEFDGMDMNTTDILAYVKEMDEQALQNYGIFISTFALLLGCYIFDIDCTMALIIDVTEIRRNKWDAVKLTINKEETNLTIDDLGAMCYHLTRFTREELKTLYHLFFWCVS